MKANKIITLVLLFAFAISSIPMIQIPAAQAATTMKSYTIADAIPNPVGTGEDTLLKCGITQALNTQAYGWSGIMIDIQKPDGTNTTLGPLTTDSTGSTYTLFTPSVAGSYIITTRFPQQEMPVNTTDMERGMLLIPKGTIFLASTATTTLVVTDQPSAQYPGHALPTEYWSRPIDPQLREWYSISGNWVCKTR